MSEDTETLRRQILAGLPARIRSALDFYDRFTATEPPEDAKGFAAWQSSAKAALTHVEVLAKLARWAEGKADDPGPDRGPGNGIDALLAEARAALGELGDDEEEEE